MSVAVIGSYKTTLVSRNTVLGLVGRETVKVACAVIKKVNTLKWKIEYNSVTTLKCDLNHYYWNESVIHVDADPVHRHHNSISYYIV